MWWGVRLTRTAPVSADPLANLVAALIVLQLLRAVPANHPTFGIGISRQSEPTATLAIQNIRLSEATQTAIAGADLRWAATSGGKSTSS